MGFITLPIDISSLLGRLGENAKQFANLQNMMDAVLKEKAAITAEFHSAANTIIEREGIEQLAVLTGGHTGPNQFVNHFYAMELALADPQSDTGDTKPFTST